MLGRWDLLEPTDLFIFPRKTDLFICYSIHVLHGCQIGTIPSQQSVFFLLSPLLAPQLLCWSNFNPQL